MKKLALILAAAIVTSPLIAAAPANAAPAVSHAQISNQPQLKINESNSGAYLITASGNVAVRWSKHPGAESAHRPYFVFVTVTNPVRAPYLTITNKAGRNAVVKFIHSTKAKLDAGKPAVTSVQAFVKSIKRAAAKR